MKRTLVTLLLFLPIFSFGQVNLKNGLVACYPFKGNAVDATGNANDGIVSGATLTTDRFGNTNSAYNFDGNSHIFINPGQFKNSSYTYATWVNLDGLPVEGEQNCFITVGGVGADQGLAVANNYSTVSTNGFSAAGYNSGNPTVSGSWSITTPNTGRWYHVVVTRDNISIKLYVDGSLIDNNTPYRVTNGTLPAYASPTYAVIGSRVGADGYFQSLRGSLDDIYIYNRAITAEEVTALYTETSKAIPCEDGIIACHPFSIVKTK